MPPPTSLRPNESPTEDAMDRFDRQLGAERRRNGSNGPRPVVKQPSSTSAAPSHTTRLRTPSGNTPSGPGNGTNTPTSVQSLAASNGGAASSFGGSGGPAGGASSASSSSATAVLTAMGLLDDNALANRHVARQIKHEVARLVLKQNGSPVPPGVTLSDDTVNRIVCTLATELSQLHQQGQLGGKSGGGGGVGGGNNRPPSGIRSGSCAVGSPNVEEGHGVASGRATIESELQWAEGRDIPQGTELSRPHAPYDDIPFAYDRETFVRKMATTKDGAGAVAPVVSTTSHSQPASTAGARAAAAAAAASLVATAPPLTHAIKPRPAIATSADGKQQAATGMERNPFLVGLKQKIAGMAMATAGGGSGGGGVGGGGAIGGENGSVSKKKGYVVTRSVSSAFSECSTSSYGSLQSSIVSQK